tara:strand:+ start:36 stop:263 length:228 start_codon:yes stop_codon:yes gene_type:complete
MKKHMNDTDLQLNRLEQIAQGLSNAKRNGICSHERRQGEGDPFNTSGKSVCLDCGKLATWEELDNDRAETLIQWT